MLTGKNRPIRQLQVEMKEILKIYLHLLHWIKQAAKLQQSLNRNRYLIARYELKMYNICSQSNQPTQFQINTGYAWRQQWTNVINAFHINAKQTTDVCQPIGSSVSDTHTQSLHRIILLAVWLFDHIMQPCTILFFKSVVYLPTHAYYYAECAFHMTVALSSSKKNKIKNKNTQTKNKIL